MKLKKLILILGLSCAALSFTGCDTVTSAIYEEVKTPTGQVQTGQGVDVADLPTDLQSVVLAQGYDLTDVVFLDELDAAAIARIQAETPSAIGDKSRVLYTVSYQVKPAVDSIIQATGAIPVPGANYIPAALTTILGIIGTWVVKNKQVTKAQQEVETKDKIVATYAALDDSLQDVVDQLGKTNPDFVTRYYEVRQEIIEKGGTARDVLEELLVIMAQNATPTKTLAAS